MERSCGRGLPVPKPAAVGLILPAVLDRLLYNDFLESEPTTDQDRALDAFRTIDYEDSLTVKLPAHLLPCVALDRARTALVLDRLTPLMCSRPQDRDLEKAFVKQSAPLFGAKTDLTLLCSRELGVRQSDRPFEPSPWAGWWWCHCFRSHSNSNMLIHPARGAAMADSSGSTHHRAHHNPRLSRESADWDRLPPPATERPTARPGSLQNTYTASLWLGLVSSICSVADEDLVGQQLLCFSYGPPTHTASRAAFPSAAATDHLRHRLCAACFHCLRGQDTASALGVSTGPPGLPCALNQRSPRHRLGSGRHDVLAPRGAFGRSHRRPDQPARAVGSKDGRSDLGDWPPTQTMALIAPLSTNRP